MMTSRLCGRSVVIAGMILSLAPVTAHAWQSGDVRDFPEAYRNCTDNDCRSAIWKGYGPNEGLNACWVAAGNNSEVYAVDTLDYRFSQASTIANGRKTIFQNAVASEDADALTILSLVSDHATRFFTASLDDEGFGRTPCSDGEVDGWARCALDRGIGVLKQGTGAFTDPENSWVYHFSPGCYSLYKQHTAQLERIAQESLALPSIVTIQSRADSLVIKLAATCKERATFDSCVPLQKILLLENVQTLMADRCKSERAAISQTIKRIDDKDWKQASGPCRAPRNESSCASLDRYIANSRPPLYGAHLNEATKLRSKAKATLERIADQRIAKAKYERKQQIVAECDRQASKCRNRCDSRDAKCTRQCNFMRREWCIPSMQQRDGMRQMMGGLMSQN